MCLKLLEVGLLTLHTSASYFKVWNASQPLLNSGQSRCWPKVPQGKIYVWNPEMLDQRSKWSNNSKWPKSQKHIFLTNNSSQSGCIPPNPNKYNRLLHTHNITLRASQAASTQFTVSDQPDDSAHSANPASPISWAATHEKEFTFMRLWAMTFDLGISYAVFCCDFESMCAPTLGDRMWCAGMDPHLKLLP